MRILWPRRSRIAVVELFGIVGGAIRTTDYVGLFEALRKDTRVKSVVLDIDSPGGSATATNYLHLALSKLAAEKPVVAFIRGLGTSGAYLLSCAATRIIAIPNALVGSIGVISLRPVAQELLRRAGIKINVAKGGRFKDMGAFWRDWTDEEVQKEQELIDQFYQDFVQVVAQARGLDQETMEEYATGEVFLARKAQTLGLIDEIGDLERALDLAAELGKVPRRVVYARPPRPWRQRLISRFVASLVEELGAELERRLMGYVRY
ncbi:MAG: signal peptide peptidase SppA [Anaerolineae bacterium]